jgi:hypothetical protein
MPPDAPRVNAEQRSGWALPLLLFAGLAIVHTWPLATSPGGLSGNQNGDAQLNEWILAWVAHALPRTPFHLFQTNIFYPAKDTLAFSEPLIVPAVLGAPMAWLGGSPVLVFNLMVMAGFALTAFSGYLLMFAWTRDRAAALLTGSTFAFNTHTLTRLAHVQGLHLYGLPLALLATDRLITTARTRDAWWLALWMTVMAYTSGYLLIFGAVTVGVALLARAPEWTERARSVGSRFALARLAPAAAIVPLWLPYHRVATEQGMVRSLAATSDFSATPGGYLAASGRIHLATWSARFFKDPVDSFFPGVVVLTLAVVAVSYASRRDARPDTLTRRRIVMLSAIAVTGFVLSLGPRTPAYGWLYQIFPPMRGLRAAARFGNLFLLGMSALAGFGLAQLRARAQPHGAGVRQPAILAAILIAVANVESLRAPFEYQRFTGTPRLYTLLADEPRVVLAEVPFYPRQAIFENAEYVLNSTAHWRPLMNGYSGYTPASYVEHAEVFWHFPRDYAIEAMRRAGVTHVMVHPDRFGHEGDEVIQQLNARPDFELLGIGAHGLRLFRLR